MVSLTIPRLIGQTKKGNIKGKCMLCCQQTEHGNKARFSNNFAGYSWLQFGECLCEYCTAFIKNQSYRKYNFLATQNDVRFLQRQDCLQYLLQPPQPPFALYITQTHKRQGWLQNIFAVNLSAERFKVVTDFVGVVEVSTKQINELYYALKKFRALKIKKDELRTGQLSMNSYKKIVEAELEEELRKIKTQIKTQVLEVLLYVIE